VKARFAKLIDVKTIVTFALTAAFVYLSVTGKIQPEIFMTIYTMVIGFYFGTQHQKNMEGKQ
jgi:uncharacterized membrane protein YfcA